MDELIKQIEAIAKEGTDLAEIKTSLEGLNPLNGIKDKAQAWDFIKKHDILLNTFDQKVGERAKTVEERIMNEKLPEILKGKEAELEEKYRPDETEAQKLAREFKEYRESIEAEKKLLQLQDDLSVKAKELGFDPLDARDFSAFGDKAFDKLEAYASKLKASIETKVSEQVKGNFKQGPPKKVDVKPEDLDQKIREARQSGNASLALKLQLAKNNESPAV